MVIRGYEGVRVSTVYDLDADGTEMTRSPLGGAGLKTRMV